MRMRHIAGVAPSKQGAKKPRKTTANKLSVDGSESAATATDAGQKKSKRAPPPAKKKVSDPRLYVPPHSCKFGH